jgi:hypothetical protein
MKEKFRSKRFNAKSTILLEKCDRVLNEYQQKGIKVTLRQVYYQLVARGIIPNLDKEYHKLSGLLTDARYCGFLDWDAIEDRIRIPHRHSQFDNILDLVEYAKYSYRLDRWEGQQYYVELFTEKDALSSVLSPIANKWHIYLNVNRGYSSATALYDASKRFLENADKTCILLYLGDHDPSGLDMVRDVRFRLTEFGCDVEVIPIALTFEQVRKYNPPPNPAKVTDSRAKGYINEFGRQSWEVDALPPDVMINLVNSAVESYVDVEKMNMVKKQESQDMKQLEEFAKQLGGET